MRTNLDFGVVSFRFVFRVFRTQHHQYCLLCCLVFCCFCCCCAATTFFFGSTCVFTLSLFGWGVSLSHFRSYVPQPYCFNIRRDIISELYKRIRYVSIHIQYACIDIHRRFAWIFVKKEATTRMWTSATLPPPYTATYSNVKRHRSSKGKSKYTMMMTVAVVAVTAAATTTTTMTTNARQKWLHYIRAKKKRREKNKCECGSWVEGKTNVQAPYTIQNIHIYLHIEQ